MLVEDYIFIEHYVCLSCEMYYTVVVKTCKVYY